ncbi:DUF6048 family protein [Cytophagales bacterium LB-30]|uniref:DUF6048 family protein n=1 Tax=Shiella aurantiaca TaxID=3058365 RepID=A0ABT8F449_9BACT|nr:DUF6048 family protein [Shiella aurantiaca]MDN4165237.1 DUF6048 family protein [Shiella aurantiaca]
MRQILLYIFSAVLLAYSSMAWAQKAPLLSGVELSANVLAPISYLTTDGGQYELGAGVFFKKRIMLAGEYGFASLYPRNAYENADYQSEGNYFKLGADFYGNVTPKDFIYFGMRYAQASFFDQYQYTIEGNIWPDYTGPLVKRENQTANWYEVILGSERGFKNLIYTGLTIRAKVMGNFNQFDEIPVNVIPGFGKAAYRVYPGVTVYVKIRLAFD